MLNQLFDALRALEICDGHEQLCDAGDAIESHPVKICEGNVKTRDFATAWESDKTFARVFESAR